MPLLPLRFDFGSAYPEEPNVPEVPEEPKGVFRTRSYIDPLMMELQGGVKTSNFEVVKLASFDRNGVAFFNDIAKYQIADYGFLEGLQFEEGGEYGSIDRKMRWLVNHEGSGERPYWMKGTTTLYFGTILFGRQLVQVETDGEGKPVEYVRRGKYPARDVEEMIAFYRVIGMRRWQMGDVSHTKTPWLVQQCTAIEGGKATDTPRGAVHYHPIWSDVDWPTNYGDGRNYVAKDFLAGSV